MEQEQTTSEEVAEYASGLNADDVGAQVLDKAKSVITDTIGVLIGASQTSVLKSLANHLSSRGGGDATIVGSGSHKVAVEIAAFVNGVGGHHIELDDSHGPSLTHPAAVMVPAALAMGEVADSSGKEVLTAIIAGYDVSARFSKASGVQAIYERGFHPSSVCGAVGAAVTAGKLLNLAPPQMTMAISLAASQSSGLLTWEDDPSHRSKSFQTGVASRNGVFSALLASGGYGGAIDSLAGRYSAIKAFGGDMADPEKLTAGLGSSFEIMSTDYKRHASCRHTHAAVDGLLDILSAESIGPEEIRSVEVSLPHSSAFIVDGNPLWTHNVQYVLAVTAYEGNVTYEHFSERWTKDPRLSAFARLVTVRGDDELEDAFPAAKGAKLRVEVAGRLIERQVPLPMGHLLRPIPTELVQDKFERLAGALLSEGEVGKLSELLGDFERLDSISPVMRLVAGPDSIPNLPA